MLVSSCQQRRIRILALFPGLVNQFWKNTCWSLFNSQWIWTVKDHGVVPPCFNPIKSLHSCVAKNVLSFENICVPGTTTFHEATKFTLD